jgi:iron complex outermembrane receptor protein
MSRLIAALLLAAAQGAFAAHSDETITVQGHALAESLATPSLERARAAVGQVAGGAAVVDAETYKAGRVGNLADALGLTAGVFIQPRFGSEEARLSIRGSGMQRTFHLRGIQLLQDGVPLTLADGGGDFQAIDPLNAQYIEVHRGANALQFGATTLGGAINLVSPTGLSAPGADLRAEYGSFDYKRTLASYGGASGNADYYLAASFGAQDGYRTHSRQENYRLSGNAGLWLTPELESRLYVYVADSDSELPGNLTRAQLEADDQQANRGNVLGDNKRDYFLWRVSNKTVYGTGPLRLELGAYYSYKDLFHPIFQVLDQVTDDYGASLRVVSELELFGRRNLFTAGFNPQWGQTQDDRFLNRGGARGRRTAQSHQTAANYALFMENQHYVLHQLALVTGLQLTRSERELEDRFLADGDAGFDMAYEAVSPKLGLRYEFDRHTQVFANVSRSFEPPSFGELSGAQLVNVLAEQSATSFEIGSRGEYAPLATQWDVAWYHAAVEDEFLSLTDANGQPLGTVSADDTLHQGLELALDTLLWERVQIRQAYLWTDARFDGDRVFGDNQLAGIPEHFYRAEFFYRWPQGYYAGPTLQWAPSETPIDHANTLFADAYAVVGLRAGYRPAHGLAWFVDARNLSDTSYAASTGVIADARGRDAAQFLPGDGLAVYGGIEWRF